MKHTLGTCLLLAALAPACDVVDTGADICTTTVKAFPENGDVRAYYRTTVEASFSPTAADDAELTVSGAEGDVPGTAEWNGKRLVFTPDQPLTPGGTYTTNISYDCGSGVGSSSVSWTVSEVGSPTGLNDLVGRGYALDLANARFIEPEGVGELLGTFLTFDILLSVEDMNEPANEMSVFGALGVEGQTGVQEPCTQTIDFPVADISENPYFELGPQVFSIAVDDVEVTIDNLFLSGSFSPDGDSIDGAILAGTVDTRPFKSLVEPDDPEPADDAVCELAQSLNVDCIECGGDNPGKFCLSLLADSIAAAKVTSPLERIDDPCALERCSAEPDCQTD